jgi:hypothetical protein
MGHSRRLQDWSRAERKYQGTAVRDVRDDAGRFSG